MWEEIESIWWELNDERLLLKPDFTVEPAEYHFNLTVSDLEDSENKATKNMVVLVEEAPLYDFNFSSVQPVKTYFSLA